jgi:hypothetical protein
MNVISFSFSTHVCTNVFGIFTTAPSRSFLASIMHDSSTDYIAKVGELASYLEM